MDKHEIEKLEDLAEEELAAGSGYIQTALNEIERLESNQLTQQFSIKTLREAIAGLLGTKEKTKLEALETQFEQIEKGSELYQTKPIMLNAIRAMINTDKLTFDPPVLLPLDKFEILKGKTSWIISKK